MADLTAPLPWRLRLLGGFALERGSQMLARLHSRSAVLLLARLALEPHAAHARETLAGWLWPQADAATGRARLRQTLSTLKATLERPSDGSRTLAIRADRLTLQLAPGAIDCDVLRFESAARRGDRAAAAAACQGEFLPGHYDEWVLEQRRRLQALADRLALGPAEIGPSTPPATERYRPVRPDDGLPQHLTPRVGGDDAVRALAEAAKCVRWLVVTGRGGLGKSRLSVEAARHLLADGQIHAARFVAWAGCTTVDDAAARVRLALSPGTEPSRHGRTTPANVLETAADSAVLALAGRRALLLLDNAEQLPDAALALVPQLLARLPALHVIVTSRRALAAEGAHTWWPQPLPVDGMASAAMQLFVDRARAVRPDFQCHAGNEAAIRAIVRRLEGLPLAIELAAARVRTLPPAQLAARLDAPGAERWHLLARRGAGALHEPRHASLEAVVAASLALLTPAARILVDLLAVSCAPVCAALAARHPEASTWAVEPAWQELVADGLLVESADDGHDRWCTLPEPVRDLVLDAQQAGSAGRLQAGWACALVSWADTLAPDWALPRVERALPLLLSLLAHADPSACDATRRTVSLMLAFGPAWQERHPPTLALEALDRALEAPVGSPADESKADLAAAATLAASLALTAGRGSRARVLASRIDLAALHDGPARAQARLLQARVAWRVDADAGDARSLLAQARAEAPGHPATMAAALSLEATLANEADGNPARAADAYRMGLHWLAAEPQAHGHARRGLRYNLAITAIYRGDAAAALPDLAALADEARTAGDRHLLAQVHNARGSALDLLGRTAEAEQATRAALAEAWDTLETENMLYALWNLGPLALTQGDARRAARLMGFADRFWRTHFGALAAQDACDVARTRRRCRLRLGRVDGQRAWDEGAALPLASAVSLALAAD
jgi:predicted ATPase/tetratricopeptide (TPR) repeat protein